MIGIINYGAGNTANVKNAFERVGAKAIVSSSKIDIKNADAIVLPGVGAFGAAMKKLSSRRKPIIDTIKRGTPFLGICLGMQLLLDRSEESPAVEGLSIFKGEVKRFNGKLPVPQIGWNLVENAGSNSPLFEEVNDFYAYFVHSYYCDPKDKAVIAATTSYGRTFVSAFAKKNVFATQFHPEKSGEKGLQILRNFVKLVRR